MHNQDTISCRKYQDGTHKMYLKLPNEAKERFIGEIQNRTLVSWRQPSKHRYRATNSIAFNYKLFRDYGHLFDKIAVQFGDRWIYTDKEFFEAHSGFKHHKKSGYERQLFMNLEKFDKTPDMPQASMWKQQFDKIQPERKPDNLQLAINL